MKFKLNIEYIKYVKIHCNGITIRAEVKSINEKNILLYVKYNADYLNLRSQEVSANFICIDGLYKIRTTLLCFEKAEPYLVIVLKTPTEMDFEQKRNFFRIESSDGCICETNIDGIVSQYSGVIKNISANGVCAIFSNYFIIDGICVFKFKLDNKEFSLKSRFVRSENYNNSYKVSLTFADISESDKDFISKVCLKKQFENKRKKSF